MVGRILPPTAGAGYPPGSELDSSLCSALARIRPTLSAARPQALGSAALSGSGTPRPTASPRLAPRRRPDAFPGAFRMPSISGPPGWTCPACA